MKLDHAAIWVVNLEVMRTFYEKYYVGVQVGSRTAVDVCTKRLQDDGFPVLDGRRRTGDEYYESMVADPEGNRIVIAE